MQTQHFSSLDDLNKALSDMGVPGLTGNVLPPEILESLLSGEGQFVLHVGDENDLSVEVDMTDNTAGLASTASGGDNSNDGNGSEAPEVEVPTITQSEMDSYIETSCDQIALLVRQRGEARQVANDLQTVLDAEAASHEACHEAFNALIKQTQEEARQYGYADALAAGLFPGQPMETLPNLVQRTLMLTAAVGLEKLDAIRNGTEPTTH